MRFLWILLGIIFSVIAVLCVGFLIFGSALAMMSGQSSPLIIVGVIALLSMAAGIYFMQKK
jgi:hypothetical protein